MRAKKKHSTTLTFLKYRPENSSLEIVNHRKTQKLISTDLSNVVTQDAQGGFQLLDLIITELKSHMTC